MKKLSLVYLFALTGMVCAGAQTVVGSGECGANGGNLTWTLTDDGTLTISGEGAMENYPFAGRAPWHNNRSTVTKVIMEKGVTNIGDRAFMGCTNLTSVILPEGVANIGDNAFFACRVSSVAIPASVTSIGDYAFGACFDLASVIIPEGVASIGCEAFSDCVGLTSVTIPASVKNIRERTFADCTGLASVTIPEGVASIGREAFDGCKSLASVTIPASVTSIGDYAFGFCFDLASVTILEGVTNIGKSVFFGCLGLKEVTVHAVLPPEIDDSCFGRVEITGITLYVPAEAVEAYKNAPVWGRFIVKAWGETGIDAPQLLADGITVFGREVTVADDVPLPVSVYDAGGRCVLRTEEQNFILPSPGVYVLRAGSATLKVPVR